MDRFSCVKEGRAPSARKGSGYLFTHIRLAHARNDNAHGIGAII